MSEQTQPTTAETAVGDPQPNAAGVEPKFGERAAYGLGDLASNLTWTTISSYLLFFYTDVALIAAAAAGTLMLLARVLDAFFDPMVGVLLDRTRTKLGRARPYLIFGAPILALLTIATFFTPATGGVGDLAWAYATFILVGFAYALVNIPYGALMAMITRDSKSRMSLSAFRFFGAAIGLIVVSTVTIPLVSALGGGDQRRGFLLTITVFALVGMVAFWIVAAATKERVPYEAPKRERGSIVESLKATAKNGPWLVLFVQSILMFARLGVLTGGAIYFALVVMGNPGAIPIILLGFSLSALVGSAITPMVLNKLGQRNGIIAGLIASIALNFALIPLKDNLWGFTLVFFLSGVVGGFGFVATPALVSDTVEYQEWKIGQRNEGLLYAGYSFATKVGTALGGAVLAWGLAAIGYTPENHGEVVVTGVLWLYISLPIVLTILQAVTLLFYKLEGQLPTIVTELEERRSAH